MWYDSALDVLLNGTSEVVSAVVSGHYYHNLLIWSSFTAARLCFQSKNTFNSEPPIDAFAMQSVGRAIT